MSADQSRRVPSQLPVAMRLLAGLKAAQRTLSMCPARARVGLPVVRSQTIAVLSALAETRREPNLSKPTL